MSTERKSRVPTIRQSAPHVLHVGISLGTWRTSVVATNGTREHFGSVVGWPRSASARRMFGRDVLFGNEAWRNRVALDLVRPLENGVMPGTEAYGSEELARVHQRAAAELIRQAVRLARPVPGETVRGVLAVPATAAWNNREALAQAARETLEKLDVVPEAWAVARGQDAPEGAFVVDVGASATTVYRVREKAPGPAEIVVLPIGGDAIDALLLKALEARHPGGDFGIATVRELKERYGCLPDGDSALVALPVGGRTIPTDAAAEVMEACRAPIGPVVEAVDRLLGTDPGPAEIILAGSGGQMKGLDRLLEETMKLVGGARVRRVVEPVFAGAFGALRIAKDL